MSRPTPFLPGSPEPEKVPPGTLCAMIKNIHADSAPRGVIFTGLFFQGFKAAIFCRISQAVTTCSRWVARWPTASRIVNTSSSLVWVR